ncbi:DUF3341 domain-containing protein [Bdellovibrio sp. HCB337]|uniref:DUF3341 domain-containing protein n=1 Tax=Bdellovibrio sp. HCB337 TaxID=3394358 RepID=UPI0039A59530
MVFEKDTTKRGHKSVFGIFDNRTSLENTVTNLKNSGFVNSDISVLMPTPESTKNFAHEKNTKAPEGATAGGTSGLAIGGVLGWLAGIGALAIPGIGPFVAAGPIVGAIAGAGIGGAVGGIAGALVGLGIPEYEAKRFETMVKDGGMLLSVHVDNNDLRDRATDILKAGGAKDVATAGEEKEEPRRSEKDKDYHPPV